jgi:hypothetical protein
MSGTNLNPPPHKKHTQLADTTEYIKGELAGNLGEVLIRCNNVMYIREPES